MNTPEMSDRARNRFLISQFSSKSTSQKATNAWICPLAVVAVLLLAASHPSMAQTESVLYNFGANGADGTLPYSTLAIDAKGNLYGTTHDGGASGYGTVFKVTPTGAETVLYSFTGGGDGGYPFAETMILDKAGNLYGTTLVGGANGYGTVFKLTSTGTETVLHSFASDGTDGYYPYAGVVRDAAGNLYGTTYDGGASGYGTVYKITPSGSETVLYSFTGGSDGCNPYSGVVLGKKKTLYGTTFGCGAEGQGVIFKVTLAGTETVLHSFNNNGMDGRDPDAGVVLDKAGNIYGTTLYGGEYGYGAVFELTPTGTETVLHSFDLDSETDGTKPHAGLVFDKAGNLYGTTSQGGVFGYGTVFELAPNGTETVLHSFDAYGTDAYTPISGVTLGKKGVLYGTTLYGGAYGGGTLYKVAP